MEQPNSIVFQAITPEKENLLEEKNYLINSDNKNFNLYIKNYSSFIIIYCYYETENNKYEYEKKYLLKQLKNNKYLALCESIDEIFIQLKMEFDKNTTTIKENNNEINIVIPINHIKIKNITFILPKKIKNEKEKYEDLKEEISFLKNENKSLKSVIEELGKNYNIINDKLADLENNNKKLFEKITKLEQLHEGNIIERNEDIINNTIILKDKIDKQKTIINWIKEKTGKNNIQFELIFRKSNNGSTSTDFHKYCDDKGPTLSLIETKNNLIIGGFTPLNWKNDKGVSVFDYSNQTFIFSLNSMKKYDLIDPNTKRAIYNWSEYGPNFGNGNIRLNANLNSGESLSHDACSFINNDKFELVGYKNFYTNELEVFKVLY